jgi:hypothetical protein
MAVTGDIINKTTIGSALAYSASGNCSGSYWTFAFGNSIFFKAYANSRSSTYESHPNIAIEFWRYSISQQSWVKVNGSSVYAGGASGIYKIRCSQSPATGTLKAEYNGTDSYLFAFKAQRTAGETSKCFDQIWTYNIGADTTYDSSVIGKLIYGRSEDVAFKFHYNSGGPGALTLSENWLSTAGMRGQLITPATIKRMISVKSAISFT